jgi:branched-chain amino acid transport system ATP-binding protein
VLSLTRVGAGYGTFQALFEVSLEVGEGEAVAVIGPNGAGKTTLLRVISKLIGVTRGEIRMNGKLLNQVPAHRAIEHGIAHVPENRRLFPRLTVEENLRVGAFLPSARARFSERLKFVYDLFPRLQERRAQLAGTLSGGEQQMCAIGRGLMSGPRLLLLDEPSAGLAPVIVQQLFELGAPAARRGLHRADRRAERAAGPQGRRPRLPAGDRPDHIVGRRRRPARKRRPPPRLYRAMTGQTRAAGAWRCMVMR